MIKGVLISVLLFAALGLGIWGYHEHQDKNAVLIHAENNYQQSYHDLTFYVDQLHNKLGSTLAMNSREAMRPQLVDVWRLATLAHSSVGQLPLTLMPFNKTNDYLSNVGQFSYETAVKNNKNTPLSNKDYQNLQQLYQQSGEVEKGLKNVQKSVLDNHLKWMDVEMALASQNENRDNQIVDGLKTVDGKAGAFSNQWSPEMKQMNQTENLNFNKIKGKKLTKKQAVQKATKALRLKNVKVSDVQLLRKGTGRSAYQMTLKDATHPNIVVSVSRHGGNLLWFIQNRPLKKNRLGLYQAEKRAIKYLGDHGLKNMTLVKSDQYDHVAVFNYVPLKNNIRIYPAMVRIKVSLDKGDIMAFDESEYLMNQSVDTTIMKPAVSAEQARGQIHKDVKIEETHLAVIKDEHGKNTLCYEFIGVKANDTYELYINAQNGNQEKVALLQDH